MADILFVMRIPMDGRDNLCPKFYGEMAGARRLGHTVHWIAWDKRGMWLCGDGEPRLLQKARFASLPAYHHLMLYIDLMSALRKLSRERKYDLMYMRYMLTFGNAPGAVKAMKERGARLVVEHPTYPFAHARSNTWWRKPFFWYSEHVYKRIHAMVDLYSIMGDDCGGELDGRPAMNVLNAVDVEALPLHTQPENGNEIHLAALASMSCWQGYDRVIRAMAAWKGKEKIVLHLAGVEGDGSLAAWMKLAAELGLQEQVIFEGELHGEPLDRLIDRCDAGVGSMAIYKRKVLNVITLKLREYMARGLPFIYAEELGNLDWEPAFCHQVPNDDSPLDLEQIVAFVHRIRRDEGISARMRAYAAEHMTWEPVMRSIFERVKL